MNDAWALRLPYITPPISLNSRMHWRAEHAVKARIAADVTWLVRQAKIPPCPAIHVQLVYVPRDRRTRDPDNLVLLQKIAVDAIRRAGVVIDDSPEYVTWSPPIIAAADPKDPHLTLEITRKDAL